MMPANAQPKPLRVFVSYSHDSAEHAERVLALADRLRRDGLDVEQWTRRAVAVAKVSEIWESATPRPEGTVER
ncbi:MAG TPA: SEFIR domain-containing protein [Thermoanaerobaculia bacterium]